MSFIQRETQKIACDIGSVSSLCCGDCDNCHKDPTDDSCDFIRYARRLRERGYRPPYLTGTVTISEEMFNALRGNNTIKILISSTKIGNYTPLNEQYKKSIKDIGLTVTDVDIIESDGAMYKMPSIEIHTIEEMIKLSDAVGGR